MYPLYLIFIVSIFLRLPSRIPILGIIRFDMLLYVILFLGLIAHVAKNQTRPSTEITKKLLILCGYIVVTLPLVKWPGSVLRFHLLEYLKVIVFYFFTIAYVNTQNRLKLFMLVFICCQVFRAFEPTYLHLTEGYWGSSAATLVGGFSIMDRLAGAPHDIINPNQLAWVIVNIVPFIYYLAWKSSKKILKIISLALAIGLLYPFFLTASRTGLVILIVVIFAILLMEGLKPKIIITAAVILIPATFLISGMLSPELSQRYLSIVDKDAPGGDTAQGRLNNMTRVFQYMSVRAIFGHGLGTSPETNHNIIGGRAQITHNMYIEAIQEIGVVGLALLLIYIRTFYTTVRDAAKKLMDDSADSIWLRNFANAIKAWVLMDLVYSIACFALTHWEWYFFGGLSAVCVNLISETISTKESIGTESSAKSPGEQTEIAVSNPA